jgi:hypothetical protein
MSSAEIQTILTALEEIRTKVEVLENKKLTIEEIGIGSFVGWVKLTCTIVLFVTVWLGSGMAILSQIDTIDSKYHAHMKYLHGQNPRGSNGTNS